MEDPGHQKEHGEFEYDSVRFDKPIKTGEDGMIRTPDGIASKVTPVFKSSPPWLEAQAEVTACHYEFARMNTITLGFTTDANQFLISFTYYAHAKAFSDEFTSPVAMEQGKTFPIFYNPLNPQENRQSASCAPKSGSTSRTPLFALGIAGSIVISLLFLASMHGCS